MSKKSILICATLLVVLTLPLIAEPAIVWEPRPQGIALAVTFFTHNENGPVSSIRIQIKNTANSVRYFMSAHPWRADIQIFYQNAQKARVTLHDYSSLWRSVPAVIQQSPMPPAPIAPGKTLDVMVDLTPAELKHNPRPSCYLSG